MCQKYHANAKTNAHIRAEIKSSNLDNKTLALIYNVSENTIRKWKNADSLQDASSTPHSINYALNELEQLLIVSVRKSSWLPLDDVLNMIQAQNITNTNRSNVYRTFCRYNINTIPQEQKDKAKTFKEYEPGCLHIDVTYLPKFDGIKYYLFVAIDRATRTMYYRVYSEKSGVNATDFLEEYISFFPMYISHVLTDNGLEFTNRLLKSKKGNLYQKTSKFTQKCIDNKIEHRQTKPFTPQTNGMVERVNQTIKIGTIKSNQYQSIEHLVVENNKFLFHYNLIRRHGLLRSELSVKTPFDAVEKWYQIKPEIFKQNPSEFKQRLLILKSSNEMGLHQQRCET
jgi:transposase-like protein